jgi:hypothetical protein
MRFGTWNVRSLYRAGSLMAAARELARCKLDLVGKMDLQEVFFYFQCHHMSLMDFVVSPPGCGRSVTDF